ncbi:MAG: DUF4783 domain-containing protein [Niabella sp.]
MKKVIALSLVGFLLVSGLSLRAQSIDGVVKGLKAGNAATVIANAGDNLALTVPDKSDNYSKMQAQQVLKDFFAKTAVKGFDLKHKGDSPNGSYGIGTLATAKGSYRVNIFMKKDGKQEVIKELRFQLIE